MISSSNFFDVVFSYWSKFYVNIITGSGVVAISIYKGLTRKPAIWNTRDTRGWVLPNIWKLEQVKNTKFYMNVSNKMLLNPARVTAFNVSELLRQNLLPLPQDIKSVFCCRFSWATCFVYQTVDFLTSYFKSSHSNWRLQRDHFLE